MEGHALRALGSDARQDPKRIDEAREGRGVLQKGSFIPGGSCIPAVTLAIFSCTRTSTLWTASLAAAAIRSSSISRSSALTEGSICTRFTSCLPFMVTFTMPPPASPTTSMVAISACAFCMLACMACACFIRLLMLPLMEACLSGACAPVCCGWRSFYRSHRVWQHGGSKTLAQALHIRVLLEGPPRGLELGLGGASLRLGGRLDSRDRRDLELDA